MTGLTWTGDDGYTLPLDGTAGVAVLEGALGLDVAPVDLVLQPWTSADGSVLVSVRREVRRVVLPLLIADVAHLRDTLGRLIRSMMGAGTLAYDDGTRTRELQSVRYESGAEEGLSGQDATGQPSDVWPLSLLALDPWWHGDEAVAVLAVDGSATPFDDPTVDFDDPDTFFDGGNPTYLTVAGDTAAQPVTTIVGPFDTVIVARAGDATLELAGPVAFGDTVTIDTRPGNRGPRRNGGPVDWSLLTSTSRLWTLPLGPSTLIATVAGADTPSAIEVAYRERWETP